MSNRRKLRPAPPAPRQPGGGVVPPHIARFKWSDWAEPGDFPADLDARLDPADAAGERRRIVAEVLRPRWKTARAEWAAAHGMTVAQLGSHPEARPDSRERVRMMIEAGRIGPDGLLRPPHGGYYRRR